MTFRTSRSLLPLLALAFACNPAGDDTDDTDADTDATADTVPPVITLEGEAEIEIVEGDDWEDPGATAVDDVDGEVDVTVDGAVNPDVAGVYILTYTAEDAAGNVATAEREVTVTFEGQLLVVSNGTSVSLVGMNAEGELALRDTLELPLGDRSTNHAIFSITPHPTLANTLFVTSANECSAWDVAGIGCWGNARIDRLTFGVNELVHDGVAFLMQAPLRLREPSYDDAAGETTLTIQNQGAAAITITSATLDLPEADEGTTAPTFTTTCDGATLQPGGTCTIVAVDGDPTLADSFTIDLETSLGDATGWYDRADDGSEIASGFEFADDVPGLPPCASAGTSDNHLQVGECVPTALAFSADGTRAYVNDDDEDAFVVFSVDGDGDFAFLNVGDTVSLQGVAVNGDLTAAYNGNCAYSIVDDVTEQTTLDCDGGNATEVVVDGEGKELLVSTVDNQTLEIWDISETPTAPTLVSSITPSKESVGDNAGRARFQHHSDDLGTFVTVDFTILGSFRFDGTELTELDLIDVPVEISPCADCDYRALYRSVQVTGDGTFAVASGFVNPGDQLTFDTLPYMGFLTSFSLDGETGELAVADDLQLPGGARSVLMVPTP